METVDDVCSPRQQLVYSGPILLPPRLRGDRRVSLPAHLIAQHRLSAPRRRQPRQQEIHMSDNYIIEVRAASGITVQAGMVVRDSGGFRFFAATRAFNALEGQLFKNPKAAEQAALLRIAELTSPRRLVPTYAASLQSLPA
jgi:hypothetical protein